MTPKPPVLERNESGDQILTPPSLVIVDVDHCYDNEVPTPVIPLVAVDDQCDHNDIPSPVSPLVVAAEVIGGRLDVQEKTSNMQEGVPRGMDSDQALATTQNNISHHQNKAHLTSEGEKKTPHQQIHISNANKNQPKGSMAKDMGNKAGPSNQMETPKSKNKPSKKKRKAARKKQNELNHQNQPPNNSPPEENPCIDFIMMDQIIDVVPLNAKNIIRDDYDVVNSEDDFDPANLPINDLDEDDEISELLIRAFSPNKDQELEKELQQVTDKQGLSPRGIHLDRLPLKKPDSPIPIIPMISTIVWNARGINTQGVIERLKNFKNIHHVSMIAVLEPFSDNNNINMFKSMLSMDNATSNSNGKIWLFWTTDISCTGIYIKTFVYEKCKEHLREPLWDRLLHLSDSSSTTPWCTIGDFNVITDIDEKLGGIPYNMRKSLGFIGIIEACGLMDLGFNGPKFTWSNQRGINFRIWKRLDMAMVNDNWLQNMPHTCITHLPSVGSDHCPLLMEMTARPDNCIKYFKFLNCWVDQPSFEDTVTACWNRPVEGSPITWSKMQFGDIYAKVKEFEERVKVAEDNLLQNNTEKHKEELHSINAEYIRYMKLEEAILKQKSQLQWFQEEDGGEDYLSIKSSMIMMNGYKVMNILHKKHERKLRLTNSLWNAFQEQIPERNDSLTGTPSIDELKEVVFSMNPNSTAGPDGMNGYFF
ncbi:hypothetical protein H5410_030593 [Solanum commersonii]|uniref:Uncharacterized protein n=1 Tax=Solanum commersonii TaxID=4109 RepID=A0A9J5YHC3_SOLCO|nr:hypothetical protein H5410_030593 [Solanum commersonii]